jgi:hypothetical protein
MMAVSSARRLIALCGLMAVLASSLEGLADRAVADGPMVVVSNPGPAGADSHADDGCPCLCRCACSGTATAVVIAGGAPMQHGFPFRSFFSIPSPLRGIPAPSPEGPPPRP